MTRFALACVVILLATPAVAQYLTPYSTEATARSHCRSAVDWANLETHVLHPHGSQYYGKTRNGAYVCEADALHAGYHVAKGE